MDALDGYLRVAYGGDVYFAGAVAEVECAVVFRDVVGVGGMSVFGGDDGVEEVSGGGGESGEG